MKVAAKQNKNRAIADDRKLECGVLYECHAKMHMHGCKMHWQNGRYANTFNISV